MALAIGRAPVLKPGRVLSPQTQLFRKVAIFGTHEASLVDAPWFDPTWELHGHASGRAWYKRDMDFYYDLHSPPVWSRGGKKTALYPKWLRSNTVPIYMQKHYPDIPASIEYPKGRILAEFGHPRPYFTNHVAWIIALLLTEGVTTIGLWGINYGIQSEYQIQRASCEYWIGRAAERGVKIILPEQCSLLREPSHLYGYESHDENGKRIKEYAMKEYGKTIKPVIPGMPTSKRVDPPENIKEEMALEEEEYLRPDWAYRPLDGKGNGGLKRESNV